MIRRVFLPLLIVTAVLAMFAAGDVRAAWPWETPAAPSTDTDSCMFCGLFSRIEESSHAFRERTFKALIGPAAGFGRLMGLWWILLLVAGLFLTPSEAPKLLETFLRRVGWLLAMVGILSSPDWILENVIDAGEKVFMGIAALVLQTVNESFQGASSSLGEAGSSGWYTAMWEQVENTILPMIMNLATSIKGDGGWLDTIKGLIKLILICFIAIPYAFVLGIFAAFLVQVIFYVSAVTAVAPLFVIGMPFGPTRSFLFAALKFLFGGGLTLVFAAVAMGATASMLSQQFGRVLITNPDNQGLQALLDITSKEYWYTLIAGFVSVLLHLAAPRIASNISGSNDSATSAAMVTAAGQYGASKAAGAAKGAAQSIGGGLLFGSQGAGGLLKNLGGKLAGKVPGAQQLMQGGLVGGAGAGLRAAYNWGGGKLKQAHSATKGPGAPR